MAANNRGYGTRIFAMPPKIERHVIEINDANNYEVDNRAVRHILKLIECYHLQGLLINTDVADFADRTILESFIASTPHIPVVTLSSHIVGASLICSDNYASGAKAIEHLICEHSSKRIAYIRGPADNHEANDRYQAYLDTLKKYNIEIDDRLIFQGDWFSHSGELAVKEFLDHRNVKFDALSAANDNMVCGAIDEMRRRSISVPDEVSVVGYDNSIHSERYGFSSIAQSFLDLAQTAVDHLIDKSQGITSEVKTIPVSSTLIIRDGSDGYRKGEGTPFIDMELANSTKTYKALVERVRQYSFSSFVEKAYFIEDLDKFWFGLCELIEKNTNLDLLESLKQKYLSILKDHTFKNINITFWSDVLLCLYRDLKKIPQYNLTLDEFFCEIIHRTSINTEQSITRLAQQKERIDYLMMVAGQRLMAATDIQTVGSITLTFLKKIDAKFACVAKYPLLRRSNRFKKKINLVALMCDSEIKAYQKNFKNTSLSEIAGYGVLDQQDQPENLIILPIGKNNQIYGFCISDCPLDIKYWPLLRPLQMYLSQATFGLEQIEIIKKAEMEANNANEAKSEFLSRMTHELRTPMNGVIGIADLLLNTELPNEQKELVKTIRDSGDFLMTLISEILDFSKIEKNKIEFEYVDFSLRACIEDVLDLVSIPASDKKLKLSYFIEDEVPIWINQDVTRLRQVLANLLSNAIKFTNFGNVHISVGFNEESKAVHVSVTDTGIGITPDQSKRLFRAFVQADSSIHRKYGGTGLGLVISKNIVELMGGQLKHDSSYKDGARFTFSFTFKPLIKTERSQEIYLTPIEKNLINLCNFIVVSDDQRSAKIIKRYLKNWNVSFQVFNLREALSAIVLNAIPWTPDTYLILELEASGETTRFFDKAFKVVSPKNTIVFQHFDESFKSNPSFEGGKSLNFPIRPKQLYQAILELTSKNAKSDVVENTNNVLTKDFSRQHPLNILLAEDNLVNQKIAKTILERCGYSIDIACSGQEVVSAIEVKTYDLILMDVIMPVMDGETATRIIRKDFPERIQPKIVAVTANTQFGDRERLLNAGMDDYISKPFKIGQLLDVLRNVKK